MVVAILALIASRGSAATFDPRGRDGDNSALVVE